MSDIKEKTIAGGPSEDDAPLVPSGEQMPLPAGSALVTDPATWYYLKATWTDDSGNAATGYAYPISRNAGTSFWDYVSLGASPGGSNALQFKLSEPDDQGWSLWDIHDDDANSGYHLSCKASGWLYRASAYDVRFRIVDGQLYCSYWGGPVGSEYRSFLVPSAQYAGMGLPPFTCELVPTS